VIAAQLRCGPFADLAADAIRITLRAGLAPHDAGPIAAGGGSHTDQAWPQSESHQRPPSNSACEAAIDQGRCAQGRLQRGSTTPRRWYTSKVFPTGVFTGARINAQPNASQVCITSPKAPGKNTERYTPTG
jgi:hypothetical protein